MYGIELLQNAAAPGRPSSPRQPLAPEPADRMRFDQVLRQVSRPKAEARPAQSRPTSTSGTAALTKPEARAASSATRPTAPTTTESTKPTESFKPTEPDLAETGQTGGAGAQAVLMALLMAQMLEADSAAQPQADPLSGGGSPLTSGGSSAAPAIHVVDAILTQLPLAAGALSAGAESAQGENAPAAVAPAPTSTQLEAFVAQAVALRPTEAAQQPAPEVQTAEATAQPTFRQLVDMAIQTGGTGGQGSGLLHQEQQGDLQGTATKDQTVPINVQPVSSFSDVAALGEILPDEVPLRPVEPEPVIRQVAQFARVILREGRSEARLQLHPEHLGQIQIKLVVADGVVKANLQVTDQAVKAALDANLEQFRTRMADQGLQVEQIQVSVGADNQFQGQGRGEQFQSQSQSRQAGHHAAAQPDGGAVEEQQAESQPGRAPSRSIGGRLNSLA